MRIKFKKGKQREFLKKVLERLSCPSLRELINRGIDVPYSTLKNYYAEERTLPENLFRNLCEMAKTDLSKMKFDLLEDNWGKVKGGKS